jgi:uroporphyrinogen decarboxylase
MGQCNAQLVGASIREFLLDPKTFVKAQVAAYERYRPDIIVMQGDLLMEPEALGNELRFPEDSTCVTTKFVLEDKGRLNSLELPDPTKDGRMPVYLEVISEAKRAITDTIVSGVLAGPWTIAIGLRGASELIRDALKDPEYVHELMRFCTQVSIRFGEALYPLKAGLSYSEAPASCSLISPTIYRTFVFPHHKQIVEHFREKKVGVGLHICGYADPILEDMIATGVTNISIDAPSDLARAVEVARGKAVVIGNVDTSLFFLGRKDEMEQAIKRCISMTSAESGFVLASGCEVPAIAPPEKVAWFMDAARRYGSYQ